MAGGLMQLVSQGQANILLNGNPSKTFFKSTYAKYTNFGLQYFRVDYEGTSTLQLSADSTFIFKIPRYADLLMDAYLSFDLPNIWSTILPPQVDPVTGQLSDWSPYEFKWIDNIGTSLIRNITITCGNQKLQEYSGEYLNAMVQRDYNNTRKDLYNRMTGAVPELTNPASIYGGKYPNAYYTDNIAGPQPSIVGRTLMIPLHGWFGFKSMQAFPLVALQYNELRVSVTLRPINELFMIRDVLDVVNGYPYVAPNFNLFYMQMYRFLQPHPDSILSQASYQDTRSVWDPNFHLHCQYCFLSNDESKLFAMNEQKYLITQINQYPYYNVTGPNRVSIPSTGMVKDYLFFFRRSDANLRNQWTNYTNWPYAEIPYTLQLAPTQDIDQYLVPGLNPDATATNLYITPLYSPAYIRDILISLGVLFDGEYREEVLPFTIYNYLEKYSKSYGNGADGIYCYNFCINTNPFDLQPSGASSMSRYNRIEFEFTTITPPLDPQAQSIAICDPSTGALIGINKPTWRIYDYNFDLYLFEERVNMVVFVGGNAGLMYAT